MQYAGDWYLWCIFAFHYDVAYLAEPMVNYRFHDLSMSNLLADKGLRICRDDEVAVLWRVKGGGVEEGYGSNTMKVRHDIATQKGRNITGKSNKGPPNVTRI